MELIIIPTLFVAYVLWVELLSQELKDTWREADRKRSVLRDMFHWEG